MARKPHTFYDPSGDGMSHPSELAERRDARAQKAQKRSLESLCQTLRAMSPARLARLGLDEEIVEAVQDLGRHGRKSSMARQLLRVQGLLRAHGAGRVQDAIDREALGAGQQPHALRWRRALLEGGDPALQEFVAQHDADRQQLRALVRRARGESPAAKRAARKLLQLVQSATPLEEAKDPSTDPAS